MRIVTKLNGMTIFAYSRIADRRVAPPRAFDDDEVGNRAQTGDVAGKPARHRPLPPRLGHLEHNRRKDETDGVVTKSADSTPAAKTSER